jgi:hypothetical protein
VERLRIVHSRGRGIAVIVRRKGRSQESGVRSQEIG